MIRPVSLPTAEDVVRARPVLDRVLPLPTPVIEASGLGGHRIVLKLETLQPTGSFKVRGAVVAVSAAAATGDPIVAASAGNHALGVAWAATRLGVLDRVCVVVPETASVAKVDGLRALGVRLVEHGADYDAAEAHGLELAARSGGRFLSGYNDPDVIAGDGTIGVELLEQVPDLTAVVVPAGGGGLVGGIALAVRSSAPAVEVIGVEAALSPGLSQSVAAGGTVTVDVGPTLADGLAGNLEPGAVTLDVLLRNGVEVLTVSEADIRSAMAYAAHKMGLVLEGAGAVGVAAVRAGLIDSHGDGRQTVVILSGRNIAPALLDEVLHC